MKKIIRFIQIVKYRVFDLLLPIGSRPLVSVPTEKNETSYQVEKSSGDRPTVIAILTVYKRDNLERQLQAILTQSRPPEKVIVYQNGNHLDIGPIVQAYAVDHVKSSVNTKFFGRFAYCLGLDCEVLVVLDDDIIPAPNCFASYIEQCISLSAIIGGNGRIATLNPHRNELTHPPDTGTREHPVLVDFVGHMWVFKKECLYDMFAVEPQTLATGEDMHLCFSAKLRSGTRSFCGAQVDLDQVSDRAFNSLGTDDHASYKLTPNENRILVERYFSDLGLNFIETQAV